MWSRRKEREKALGFLSVNIPQAESLCHCRVNTCSLNSAFFRGYHRCTNFLIMASVMQVISQKIQFGIDAPSSFYLSIEKDPGQWGKRKAKWKWQAVREVIVSDMRHWRPLTFTLTHTHGVNSGSISTQTNNNVPQQLWAQSGSIT